MDLPRPWTAFREPGTVTSLDCPTCGAAAVVRRRLRMASSLAEHHASQRGVEMPERDVFRCPNEDDPWHRDAQVLRATLLRLEHPHLAGQLQSVIRAARAPR